MFLSINGPWIYLNEVHVRVHRYQSSAKPPGIHGSRMTMGARKVFFFFNSHHYFVPLISLFTSFIYKLLERIIYTLFFFFLKGKHVCTQKASE